MEGSSRREELCPQLLDLIPQNREWLINREKERSHGSSEEKKLELRLGPPGQDWPMKEKKERDDESLLSLSYFAPMASTTQRTNINNSGNQPHKFSSPSPSSTTTSGYQGKATTSFLQSLPVMAKEASQPCCPKVVDLQNAEKKAFSRATTPANTAVTSSSQKRFPQLFSFLFSLVSIFIFWTEDIHSKTGSCCVRHCIMWSMHFFTSLMHFIRSIIHLI